MDAVIVLVEILRAKTQVKFDADEGILLVGKCGMQWEALIKLV